MKKVKVISSFQLYIISETSDSTSDLIRMFMRDLSTNLRSCSRSLTHTVARYEMQCCATHGGMTYELCYLIQRHAYKQLPNELGSVCFYK